MIKAENMTGNSGRAIANQLIIRDAKGTYFQSYDSVIAFVPYDSTKKTRLDKYKWDYSPTTGKYRNLFLRENKKETERKIKEGFYVLTDLNK